MNAIIVLNYNNFTETKFFVKQIERYGCFDVIVVVDNCSTDGKYEDLFQLRTDTVHVIKTEKNNGYAIGNNYGIHFVLSRWPNVERIYISNPDIEFDCECIEKIEQYMASANDVAIVAPVIRNIDGVCSYGWDLPNYFSMMGEMVRHFVDAIKKHFIALKDCNQYVEYPREYFVDCVLGCFFCLDVGWGKKISFFDEGTFLFGEESILGFRIKKSGGKNVILTDCLVNHKESTSINITFNSRDKAKIMLNSRLYYMKKYMHCNFFQCITYCWLYNIVGTMVRVKRILFK